MRPSFNHALKTLIDLNTWSPLFYAASPLLSHSLILSFMAECETMAFTIPSLENLLYIYIKVIQSSKGRGVQPKYIGSIQEKHPLREKEKNTNIEILQSYKSENYC